MTSLANELQTTDIIQEIGTLLQDEHGELVAATASGQYRARRAVSCLVAPQRGDLVLLATTTAGSCYVLAVLERDGDEVALSVDGDLAIDVKKGRFSVTAGDGVDVVSGKDVSVVSGSVDVNAVEGKVVLQRLSYLGRYLLTEVEKVKSFAGTFDMVLERFSQKVKRSYRTVEEIEQVRAERIDYVAKQNMNLRGKNTLMTAEQLVKVDGEQIHLG
jgi:hypothetical protein